MDVLVIALLLVAAADRGPDRLDDYDLAATELAVARHLSLRSLLVSAPASVCLALARKLSEAYWLISQSDLENLALGHGRPAGDLPLAVGVIGTPP